MAEKFFLVIPPGFEILAQEELKEKWPIHFTIQLPPNDLKPGGIDLETDISYGMALNQILKIPTRILLRVDNFKCRDFPKLFKKVVKINWNNYLLGKIPEINSTSKNSRIFDSRKIEKCFHDGILEYFKRQPPKKKNLEKGLNAPLFSLFVRFENDECLISIDSSGDPLYKRGIKTLSSSAPIRENLAAALLYFLKKNLQKNTDLLIDPMCGSGTFLLESANFYGLNNQRGFDFKYFPLMEKIILPDFSPKELGLFKKHYGFDIDEKMIKNATSNLEGIGAILAKRDIFSKVTHKESPNIVIINPPYGKRIKEVPNFKKLIQTIKENYSPNLLGIIVPSEIHLNLGKKISFKNGGFKVNFWVFKP